MMETIYHDPNYGDPQGLYLFNTQFRPDLTSKNPTNTILEAVYCTEKFYITTMRPTLYLY